MTVKKALFIIIIHRSAELTTVVTYFNGDSAPFSAIALIALSIGICTFAQARSNSIRLCAHFEAISSNPDLDKKKTHFRWSKMINLTNIDIYPTSRVTEHPERNKCFRSQVGNRMRLSWVSLAHPRTSSNCSFVLIFRIRCKNSSLISRDSSVNDAIDSSSRSGKPGESIYVVHKLWVCRWKMFWRPRLPALGVWRVQELCVSWLFEGLSVSDSPAVAFRSVKSHEIRPLCSH